MHLSTVAWNTLAAFGLLAALLTFASLPARAHARLLVWTSSALGHLTWGLIRGRALLLRASWRLSPPEPGAPLPNLPASAAGPSDLPDLHVATCLACDQSTDTPGGGVLLHVVTPSSRAVYAIHVPCWLPLQRDLLLSIRDQGPPARDFVSALGLSPLQAEQIGLATPPQVGVLYPPPFPPCPDCNSGACHSPICRQLAVECLHRVALTARCDLCLRHGVVA